MALLYLHQMDFELPVTFNEKQHLLPAQLHQYGYTSKIEVNANGTSVLFEKDEEGGWRDIIDPSELEKNKSINASFLQAIANAIEEVLKPASTCL
jgi:hypothetical protein